jgi:hypothetical protein
MYGRQDFYIVPYVRVGSMVGRPAYGLRLRRAMHALSARFPANAYYCRALRHVPPVPITACVCLLDAFVFVRRSIVRHVL